MELLVLCLFCLSLLACILLGQSILYALTVGLALFLFYGKYKGFSWVELIRMALSGVKTIKNILITFLLIGMLTALWRQAGTIPVIVCYASRLIRPSIFLVMTFLLNCGISVLTGTAFGTAATMGVICATMGATLGTNPVLLGGAVLAGVYFGDRCSPVSTSALLVAELTGTSIFRNIKNMVRSALVPFAVSCIIFTALGFLSGSSGQVPDLNTLFGREFRLHWAALLPAAVILMLSALQVNVKLAMSASILTALPIAIFLQGTSVSELPTLLLMGYRCADSEVAAMLSGGGIRSMLNVTAIVCLSSSYSGIFQKTGLLDRAKDAVRILSARTNPYTATLCTSVAACMVACNQTLTIMLTHQLCAELEPDKERAALNLEDTAVVVAPLIPWSIAGAVTLSSIGAPMTSILPACFLYLLPLWRLLTGRTTKSHI